MLCAGAVTPATFAGPASLDIVVVRRRGSTGTDIASLAELNAATVAALAAHSIEGFSPFLAATPPMLMFA